MGLSAGGPGRRAGGVRVLMVVRLFHPWVGGTERQAHSLARALVERGHDVRIVTGRWFRGTPRREVLDGVPVFRNQTLWECFGIRGLRKFGGYLYIASLLLHLWRERDDYDVIHVHGLNYHAFAAVLAGRRLGRPVLAKLANSGPASDVRKMRESRQLALARFMLPTALGCDRFVALNPAVVAELTAAGVPPERIVSVPNGVDTRRPPRRDHHLHDPACLLFVGRLHPQKGVDTLLRAFALLRPRLPRPAVLRIVGDGPRRDQLRALAVDLGVDAHVEFAGQRDDVGPYLDAADVFVLPSRAEGLSNALLEAMAAGIPPVVSDVAGNRDGVRDGHSGLTAAVDDPPALAAALQRLLGDRTLRARLGAQARRAAERDYGLDAVAARYVALYEELRDGTAAPAPATSATPTATAPTGTATTGTAGTPARVPARRDP